MLEAFDQRVSSTDPDARSMNAKGVDIVGYKVQAAVDTRHHLIVAHRRTGETFGRVELWKDN